MKIRNLTSGMELTGKGYMVCVKFQGSQSVVACSSSRDVSIDVAGQS